MGNFNRSARNGGKAKVKNSGYISMREKTREYKGEERYEFSGSIVVGSSRLLISIPVDADGQVFAYEGKGKLEGTRLCRVNVTEIENKNSRR